MTVHIANQEPWVPQIRLPKIAICLGFLENPFFRQFFYPTVCQKRPKNDVFGQKSFLLNIFGILAANFCFRPRSGRISIRQPETGTKMAKFQIILEKNAISLPLYGDFFPDFFSESQKNHWSYNGLPPPQRSPMTPKTIYYPKEDIPPNKIDQSRMSFWLKFCIILDYFQGHKMFS